MQQVARQLLHNQDAMQPMGHQLLHALPHRPYTSECPETTFWLPVPQAPRACQMLHPGAHHSINASRPTTHIGKREIASRKVWACARGALAALCPKSLWARAEIISRKAVLKAHHQNSSNNLPNCLGFVSPFSVSPLVGC